MPPTRVEFSFKDKPELNGTKTVNVGEQIYFEAMNQDTTQVDVYVVRTNPGDDSALVATFDSDRMRGAVPAVDGKRQRRVEMRDASTVRSIQTGESLLLSDLYTKVGSTSVRITHQRPQ